jgi:hypothetical protein
VNGEMSERELETWVKQRAAGLQADSVVVDFGRGLRRKGKGSAWVSLSSPWATARLVRDIDGASRREAHRYSDGLVLVREVSTSTSEDQLEVLVRAVARPVPA